MNNFGVCKIIEIEKITKDGFVTKEEHNLRDNQVIVLSSKEEYWFARKESAETKDSDYLFFKVKIKNEKVFELYEYCANPMNPYCCRHIHHINRNKNGWIVGTGEMFPNSWLLFLFDKELDKYSKNFKSASSECNYEIINSGDRSVQRTMGCVLDGDTIIYASDHATFDDFDYTIGNKTIHVSSTGVYIGSIANINDMSTFRCIFEATEPAYLFKKVHGILLFCGQLGELALSKNLGSTWTETNINASLSHMNGKFNNGVLIDNHIFIFK